MGTNLALAEAVERLEAALHDGGEPGEVYGAAGAVCDAYFAGARPPTEVFMLTLCINDNGEYDSFVTVHGSRESVQREIDSTMVAYGIDADIDGDENQGTAVCQQGEPGEPGTVVVSMTYTVTVETVER